MEAMTTSDKTPAPPRTIVSVAPGPRRTIASYASYAEAESAVDRLADGGFPVERSAIVGTGLRSVEQVEGRMTAGRAALVGATGGIMLGALLALLAGIFPWDSGSAETVAYALVLGAVFGAVSGALYHEALSGGRRDFISATRIEADRYDLQVDEDSAGEAARLLSGRPR
jgi:Heat induced stress protein YflT domain